MNVLYEPRLLFVVGKGGVGKSVHDFIGLAAVELSSGDQTIAVG